MKVKKSLVLAAAVAAAVAAPGAFATNGYYSHGYGMAAKGMGGVGIAVAQDGMATATNPANQMSVGSKLTFGMDWFRPFRSATRIQSGTEINNYKDSGSNDYYIPEFAYATTFGSSSSLGVVVYGAGLGVDYGIPWTVSGGTTNLFVLYKQMTIAPTWATKVGNHSFGVSLNLVRHSFDARGLQGFAGFTTSGTTNNLTDKGEDAATGIGWKFGWVGELTPAISLGAYFQPETNMSKFGRYSELFAEQGDLDVPQQYGIGLAWKVSPATTVGFDAAKIKWSGVKSMNNTADIALAGHELGTNNGLGFGWQDQTVYKLGVSHQLNSKWTLRAGYEYAKMPITAKETLFNTIFPAVTETHYTLGATWQMNNTTDLGLAYMYSPSSEIKGSGTNTPSGMTNPDLKMNQNSFGISLNVKM
jgi:long-chain fatty acid transport protein